MSGGEQATPIPGEPDEKAKADGTGPAPEHPGAGAGPAVRKNFADAALWVPTLKPDKDGVAEVSLTMPENLTGWKVKAWAMGHGTKVGQGEAEVVTRKDLLVRLQAPRFFVEKDEVVLSANVHNYLKGEKTAAVTLEVEGGTLALTSPSRQEVRIPAGGERRVDWRVKVTAEGEAVVRMKAVTDEESDAMQMRFPCLVHGMLKTDSYSGVVRASQEQLPGPSYLSSVPGWPGEHSPARGKVALARSPVLFLRPPCTTSPRCRTIIRSRRASPGRLWFLYE